MYEESIEHQPREVVAHTGAIAAWLQLHEFEKAEKDIHGCFAHLWRPSHTYGRMAKMYWDWRKRDKAEEMAIRALQGNKEQPEAKAVMEAMQRSVRRYLASSARGQTILRISSLPARALPAIAICPDPIFGSSICSWPGRPCANSLLDTFENI